MVADATLRPWVIRPAPLILPPEGPSRLPPRDPSQQEPGYLEAFDTSTLFYDVFKSGRRVMAIGPPAGSLSALTHSLRVVDDKGRLWRLTPECGLDRMGRYRGKRARDDREHVGNTVRAGDDLAHRFRGRRAVVTVSKDNDLEWVSAWGAWYASRHRADALIIYDNGSTIYTLEELSQALAAVPGIAVAAVVDWPFKYGPIARPPHMMWDSNFAQHGALEHARWRLLRRSAGYLNADLDELIIDADGRSVFGGAAARPSGVLHFRGIWAYPGPETPQARVPRHSDSTWIRRDAVNEHCAPKWCVVPSRLPRRSQLTVHKVTGVPGGRPEGFFFWHLRNISTNWDSNRTPLKITLETHREDDRLRARFDGSEPPPSESLHRPSLAARLKYLPMRLRLAAPNWLKNAGRTLGSGYVSKGLARQRGKA